MTILIEVIYFGQENEILRKGNFPVNEKKFKEDPNHAAADIALRWILQIRKESTVSRIIKVKYNAIDITDLVQDLYHNHL